VGEIVEGAERPKCRKYSDLSELTDLLFNPKTRSGRVPVSTRFNMCRDYKDNFLLWLSISGAATHMLTGDKVLLVITPFGKI